MVLFSVLLVVLVLLSGNLVSAVLSGTDSGSCLLETSVCLIHFSSNVIRKWH